jgi:hypothetical protein
MFFFFFNNKFEIVIGASPKEADLAIVSINAGGTVGELNQMVLDEYGYNKSVLKNLDLKKGYSHYKSDNGKLILFIVTVGNGSTENNLFLNLLNCLENYSEILNNKKVWIPLMGTGAGGLKLEESFNITQNVIQEYLKKLPNPKVDFLLSIPNSNDGKILFNKIDLNSKNKTSATENEISKAQLSDEIIKLIDSTSCKFHLVGSNWGSEGDQSERFYKEGIWENGYGEEKFGDRVNKVTEGDVLFNKSTYAKQDGSNYLRIKGIAIVTKNPKDSTLLYCNWIFKNIKIDIEDLSHYRDTISEPSKEGLITILFNLDENILREIFINIKIPKKIDPSIGTNDPNSKNEENENEQYATQLKLNTTTLAGLISDADTGTDYLEISKDVNAFARVMAAKSFEPPLAIALLGKWGSGKSFFMRKLKEGIQTLSKENPEKQFCEGIAHVHFNAWSYMDANLWASIVTRIFEGLNDYIKNSGATEVEIKQIEKQLFQKLSISKEELSELTGQKEKVQIQIKELEVKKEATESELKNKIDSIRKSTLVDIISRIDSEFKVKEQIEKTLNENPTFVESSEKFEKLVPKKYWDDPKEFYNQLNSAFTFIKAFFHRAKWKTNIVWVVSIVAIISLTPVITYLFNLLISWQDFTLTNKQCLLISLYGTTFTRGIDTFLKLKKQIAPFWAIKEDYESKKENALFIFEQEQKAIQLEIEKSRDEIIQLNNQIAINEELKATLEFKLKSALTTEALYSFIEKRANSDDYKKHLGIVSLIRKDFEILSGLLTGHHTELISNKDSDDFKKLFSKPLERIILYIDDLDRCPEERVVEVLEAVNLLMAFPLFVVVVGVDPRWVKTALENKYKNQFDIKNENEDAISPSNYLEKIFQVPFHLKDAGDASIKNMIKTLAQAKPNIIRLSSEEPPLIEVLNDEPDFEPDYYDVVTKNENEIVIRTNIFDDLLNKETIEALEISEKECELMQDMSEIIGNNPRAVKRFVNIYRIVKTHEDFIFDNEETKEDELAIVMLLLAIPIGRYKILTDSIEKNILSAITNVRPNFDYFSVAEFFEITSNEYNLKKELGKIMSRKLGSIKHQKIELYKKHYQFIKRFTFKNI